MSSSNHWYLALPILYTFLILEAFARVISAMSASKNGIAKKQQQNKILYKCALTNTISDVLASREGWAQINGDDWQFFWVTREWMTTQFDRHKFGDRQLVCHFRNDFELTRKDFLVKNYKKTKKLAERSGNDGGKAYGFIPSSYVLPVSKRNFVRMNMSAAALFLTKKTEYHLFVEEFRKYPPDTTWIMKPVAGAQGKGIFLFRKLKDIQEWKKQDVGGVEALPYVVQCYIQNPYLIGGKKFDVRLYVLVTSFRPLNVWVHREGFARFSHSRYDPSSVDDAFVHLTNVAVAKTAVDYDPERGLKWSLDRLFRYMKAVHGNQTISKMMTELGMVIVKSLQCVSGIIIQDSHCFELYGYDILFDDHLKPWLLEVNASPSLTASSQEDFELKSRVLNDMLDVLDLEKKLSGGEQRIGGFDLLVQNGNVVEKSRIPGRTSNLFVSSLNIRLGDFKAPKPAG